jgi:hypothetical protein
MKEKYDYIDCSCSKGEEDLKENLGEFCLFLEILV